MTRALTIAAVAGVVCLAALGIAAGELANIVTRQIGKGM